MEEIDSSSHKYKGACDAEEEWAGAKIGLGLLGLSHTSHVFVTNVTDSAQTMIISKHKPKIHH